MAPLLLLGAHHGSQCELARARWMAGQRSPPGPLFPVFLTTILETAKLVGVAALLAPG